MAELKELRIPHMGSVENARMVTWRIAEGSPFREGDVLYEIETDKTVTEVPAESEGILARRAAEAGAELKVGDLVGWTARANTSAGEIAIAVARVSRGPSSARVSELAPRISPRARRLAKEAGLDPSQIASSGGRIRGDDVLRSVNAATTAQNQTHSEVRSPTTPSGYESVPVDLVLNSTRRRAIARRLSESVRAAPQLTADVQVDLTRLLAARAGHNAGLAGPLKVSVLSYVALAATRMLLEHRALNAAYSETHTFHWRSINLGIAVDTSEGLVVPVIRGAESLGLSELNTAIAEVASRARSRTLRQDELEGCTFTISNPGALGPVLRAEAILNPPQVALLGLPAIQYVPIALEPENYRIEVRPVLRPSLTFDHRALDGGQVIRFLSGLKEALEQAGV